MAEYNNYNPNEALDWNSVIQDDGKDFIDLLPDGEYVFTVSAFERQYYPGGPKLPACPRAHMTLEIVTDEGIAHVFTDIFLYRGGEWKISSFFRCIGVKEKGESIEMDWNGVVGARGRARIGSRSYTDRNGNQRTINEVKSFLPYELEKMPETGPAQFTEVKEDGDPLPF